MDETDWAFEVVQKLENNTCLDATAITIIESDVKTLRKKVLIIGDYDGDYHYHYHDDEVYDEDTNSFETFSRTGDKIYTDCQAAPLHDGTIFVVSGFTPYSYYIYDTTNRRVETYKMPDDFVKYQSFAPLKGGSMLMTGGLTSFYEASNKCYIFKVADSRVIPCKARMTGGRFNHKICLLRNGNVMIFSGCRYVSDAAYTTEWYDATRQLFVKGPDMLFKRFNFTATTMLDGRVLLCGGLHTTGATEIYDPSTNEFHTGPEMMHLRFSHFAALLSDGRVLVGGGYNSGFNLTTEIYDPRTNSFTLGPPLRHKRHHSTAVAF
jgi:hypothetical protein